MFYMFMRNINIMFLVLSIICSAPCILLALAQLKYGDSLDQFDNDDYSNLKSPQGFNYTLQNYTTTGTQYATQLSIGTMFRNPYNATFNKLFSVDKNSNLFRADVIVYINILGVVYLLLHSIYLRKFLVQTSIILDRDEISPSDFAILVRGLPADCTKDKLKEQFEADFANCLPKVSYVNLCYDISKMVEFNQKLQELAKQKGAYKLYLKKEMKEKGLNKKMLLNSPTLIPNMVFKTGLLSKKELVLVEIEKDMRNTFKEMAEFSTQLVPGKQENLFLGVGIVVLQTQKSQVLILKTRS